MTRDCNCKRHDCHAAVVLIPPPHIDRTHPSHAACCPPPHPAVTAPLAGYMCKYPRVLPPMYRPGASQKSVESIGGATSASPAAAAALSHRGGARARTPAAGAAGGGRPAVEQVPEVLGESTCGLCAHAAQMWSCGAVRDAFEQVKTTFTMKNSTRKARQTANETVSQQ